VSKGSTTSAEIPAELKVLYQTTGNNATALQNRLWTSANGGGKAPFTPGRVDRGPLIQLTDDGNGGGPVTPIPGDGGGAHGQASDAGGAGASTGNEPPELGSEGYLYDSMLDYNPAGTPGMSSTQRWAKELLWPMVTTPGEENAAWDIARSTVDAAERLPNDWGSWSRAGRMPTISVASLAGNPDSGGASGGGGRSGEDSGGAWEQPEVTPAPELGQVPAGSWITDPTIRAAREIFDRTGAEQVKNAMTQAGLGRSTATGDSLGRAWAGQLMPLLESQMGRQERAIERQQAAEEAQLAREQAGIERGVQARQFAANLGMQRGAADTARYAAGEQAGERIGGLEREISQGQIDAAQREKLRLQALAEQSLFGPLGGFLPSTIGSSTGKNK